MLELQSLLNTIDRLFDVIGDSFSIFFILMIVFTFIDGATKKKNQPLPPPIDDEFDIPTLANDPNIVVREEVVVKPPDKVVPRGVTNNVTEAYRQKYEQQKRLSKIEAIRNERRNEKPSENAALNAEDALNAMMLAEIFDKPKALRRRD